VHGRGRCGFESEVKKQHGPLRGERSWQLSELSLAPAHVAEYMALRRAVNAVIVEELSRNQRDRVILLRCKGGNAG
jgi:hypothetical protein